MEAVQLSAHVTMLPGDRGGAFPHGNPLVVRGGDTTVQIDSSIAHPARNVDLVLLSHGHEDHMVGLGGTAAPVMVHCADLPTVQSWGEYCRVTHLAEGENAEDLRRTFALTERPDATAFHDDTVIDVGGGVTIRVVPLPGHTAGHCGFYVEPDGVFFTADVDLSSFGPVYCDEGSVLADVRASLARCAEIDAAVYATFHHKGCYTDRDRYRADLAVHTNVVDVREERIRALLQDRARSAVAPAELVGQGVVFTVGGRRPWYADTMEEHIIAAHMAEPEQFGRVAE